MCPEPDILFNLVILGLTLVGIAAVTYGAAYLAMRGCDQRIYPLIQRIERRIEQINARDTA